MNVQEVLEKQAAISDGSVHFLDVEYIAPKFERALRAAAGKGHEQGHYSLGYNPDECVTAGVAAMGDGGGNMNLRKLTLWHTIDWYASSVGTEHEKEQRKVLDQAIDAALAAPNTNSGDVINKLVVGINDAPPEEG